MRKGRSLAHCASRYHGRRDGSNRKPQRGRGGAGQSSRRPAARGEGRRAARAALRAGPHERRHQDRHAAHGRAGYRAIGSPRAPLRSGRLHPGRHHPERERRAAVREQQLRLFSTYSIRGLASQFYRDGVLDASQVNGYLRTLTDVARVDILKGPGSALYGSGAPGGTISLISKLPTPTPYYSATGVGGSFATYQFGTDLGGPLGETLGYRFHSDHFHTEGF